MELRRVSSQKIRSQLFNVSRALLLISSRWPMGVETRYNTELKGKKGGTQIRTEGGGFAGPSLTTWRCLRKRMNTIMRELGKWGQLVFYFFIAKQVAYFCSCQNLLYWDRGNDFIVCFDKIVSVIHWIKFSYVGDIVAAS